MNDQPTDSPGASASTVVDPALAGDLLPIAGRLARMGSWVSNLEQQMVFWSDEVAAIHDEPPGVSRTIDAALAYVVPGHRPRLDAALAACVRAGAPLDEIVPIVTARQRTVWVRIFGEPVRNDAGRVVMLRGAMQDISDLVAIYEASEALSTKLRAALEREAFELRLRTAETEMLELVSSNASLSEVLEQIARKIDARVPDATSSILLMDADGVRLRFGAGPNLPEAYNLALDGIEIGPRAGSCGTAAYERRLVVVEDIATDYRWEEHRELSLAFGLRACWSVPVLGADRRVLATFALYYRSVAAPSADDIRWVERIAHIVGLAIQRIRERNELRVNEQRFRSIARATVDVVWDWDIAPNAFWWNEGLRSVFGYDPATFSFRQWGDRLHPEDRERVLASLRAARDGTDTHWHQEYRFLRASGAEARVVDRGYIIRDESGAAVRMVGSMTDVTKERELEEQLRQAQRLEVVGKLTGGVAHDFNNLLTVIVGNTEVLADRLSADPGLRSLAEMTRIAAERGADLTSRLLAFSRRQALDPRPADVNVLVARMDGLLRRTLGEDVDIELALAGELPTALVDATQLESALMNLCINARDAMPNGGRVAIRTAHVQIEPTNRADHAGVEAGDYVVVTVTDTGTGMDDATLARAFEPFFTTKEVGKGSGLGLSMVYGFVKQSNGHVRIDSEPGTGTTVRLYLPTCPGVQDAPRQPRSTRVRSRGGHEKILLVEDDDAVRQHVEAQLKSLGYQVVSAADGAAALALLKQHDDIDLLFSDIVMPGGMTGRQLADEVKRLYPRMPVLYTSGYADNVIVHDGRLEPDVELLQKPYRRQELAAKVRAVLDRSTWSAS